MIASRALKVYKINTLHKEEYVTTVFSGKDAGIIADRLNAEMGITGVRYRNIAGDTLLTLHRNKKKK